MTYARHKELKDLLARVTKLDFLLLLDKKFDVGPKYQKMHTIITKKSNKLLFLLNMIKIFVRTRTDLIYIILAYTALETE